MNTALTSDITLTLSPTTKKFNLKMVERVQVGKTMLYGSNQFGVMGKPLFFL